MNPLILALFWLGVLVSFLGDPAHAFFEEAHRVQITRLEESALNELRGGFETGSGLRISFGIERVVWINGQMTAQTSLNLISQSGRFPAEAIDPSRINLGVIALGPQNFAQLQAGEVVGTLIQNSLDGQQIRNVTTLNATVNSASLLKAERLHQSLRDAMVGSFRR
jgi:hypothetical protein